MAEPDSTVAVVGLALRVPGAADPPTFWANIYQGVVTLPAADAPVPSGRRLPAGQIDRFAEFDAELFGVLPTHAALTDPQHRVLTELVWEALEDAGTDTQRGTERVGVFVGSGPDDYLHDNVLRDQRMVRTQGPEQVRLGNSREFLATALSYRLDFTGPSITVQTACSTSLVAVHQAVRSLLTFECDIAIAGGVTVFPVERPGYEWTEGGIYSPDGRCRSFTEGSQGTVPSSGAGVVVLRRSADLGDMGGRARAHIVGSAVNNDGADRMSMTAPSPRGQAEVIREALESAGLTAADVGYVEAHGTGTVLGDQVELAALAEVYGADRTGRCALGTVKANIGHCDTAAGVIGLIKAVLALQQDILPPIPAQPGDGPDAQLGSPRLFIPRQAQPWSGQVQRRAGVSSFGIGGTNAHVVLAAAEPAPVAVPTAQPGVAVLSAATPQALRAKAQALIGWLDGTGASADLSALLGTLWHGRRRLARRMAVAMPPDPVAARERLREALAETAEGPERSGAVPEPSVAVLLPGQSVRLVGVGAAVAAENLEFAADLARLHRTVLDIGGPDLRTSGSWVAGDPRLRDTAVVQPLLFSLGLAALWHLERRGVRPGALLGHSVGELTAAAYAGVFKVPDAVAAVVRRGALMGEAPAGAMLAVPLAECAARELSAGLAADVCGLNGPEATVLGADAATVDELEWRCRERGISATRLETAHAFHSRAMGQAGTCFGKFLRTVELSVPRLTVISNLTGAELTAEQATDPGYWASQLRSTVRLDEGVHTLLAGRPDAVIGLHQGGVLTNPVRQLARRLGQAPRVVELFGRAGQDEALAFTDALAQLWAAGCAVSFEVPRPERPTALPGYPFAATRYWIESAPPTTDEQAGAPVEIAEPAPPVETVSEGETDEIAVAVTAVWQEAFGGAPLRPADNFFTLGGTSLQAAQLITVINDQLLIGAGLGDLYEHSHLGAFISRVQELAIGRDDAELLRLLDELEAGR